jgi:hypothetical protein
VVECVKGFKTTVRLENEALLRVNRSFGTLWDALIRLACKSARSERPT